jgi:hypothetical protein
MCVRWRFFAGFVVAFHVLAALALVVPLAMLDPDHAPLYGWTGYLVRWVPIVTVAGILLFVVQMAWHVRVCAATPTSTS